MRTALLFLLALIFINSPMQAQQQNLNIPPSDKPFPIEFRFFLVNLISVNEKNEVFTADVYFTFNWEDPRLAFEAAHERDVEIYTDDEILEKFKEMWRPQIEFQNTSVPTYGNRSLFIYPDGRVEYNIRVTADFRTKLDFTRFPFDKQNLRIVVDSFIWNKNVFYFVPSKKESKNLGSEFYNDEQIKNINVSVIDTTGIRLKDFGDNNQYSTIVVDIGIARKTNFFVYQIIIPLFLIMALSCAVFFSSKGDYTNCVMISLTAFLVFLAAKFTINLDLPRVGYMTLLDNVFLISYLIIGTSVVICTLRELWGGEDKKSWPNRINFHARWAVLLIYTVITIYFFTTNS